jgi:phosphoribosyl 1,2-cyclic phosphodiesterase
MTPWMRNIRFIRTSIKLSSINAFQRNFLVISCSTITCITAIFSLSCMPDTVEDKELPAKRDHDHRCQCHIPIHTITRKYTYCEMEPSTHTKKINNTGNKIIFLGSGSSTGCPRPLCSLLFSDSIHKDHDNFEAISPELNKLREQMLLQCQTSILASVGNPIDNKDYRNNPSLLISIVDPESNRRQNVVIDVGKTFREGAIRWLPKYHIHSVDAIILTHQHMDAAAGLDDVRGFQTYHYDAVTKQRHAAAMPVYLSNNTLSSLQDQFPWLLPKQSTTDKETVQANHQQPIVIKRHVASFDVTIFEPFQAFEPIPGLSIVPLPLIHGEDLISYGFAFTLNITDDGDETTMNVVYLSDISRMLPETLDYIQNKLSQPIHILVLDSLLIDSSNPVHYCLPQSMELIKQLQPKQTYLVGMNCDSFGPHNERNTILQNDYNTNVQLAYDGLVIPVRPSKEQSQSSD